MNADRTAWRKTREDSGSISLWEVSCVVVAVVLYINLFCQGSSLTSKLGSGVCLLARLFLGARAMIVTPKEAGLIGWAC